MVAPRFLLDTNAISEGLRLTPHPQFLERFSASRDALAMAAPTWHELLYGLQRLPAGRKRDTIEDYLLRTVAPSIPVLPYAEAEAAWHASERARLVADGRTPPFADGCIAAVAACANLVLVTRNVRDFEGFRGLRLEDWTA